MSNTALIAVQMATLNQMRDDPNYQSWLRSADVHRADEVMMARFGWALAEAGMPEEDARAKLAEARDRILSDERYTALGDHELEMWLDANHKRLDLIRAELIAATQELFEQLRSDAARQSQGG